MGVVVVVMRAVVHNAVHVKIQVICYIPRKSTRMVQEEEDDHVPYRIQVSDSA